MISKKLKKKILNIVAISIASMASFACTGGAGGSNIEAIYNPQPLQSNATNYFSTYSPYSNQFNNTIFQVIYSTSSKQVATGLALFNLANYSQASTTSSAIQSFTLTANNTIPNNYDIYNNVGIEVGQIQITGNNIILTLNYEPNKAGVLGEFSTVLIATTNQLPVQAGNYYGFCFNLPTVLANSGTNYGSDICQYQLNSDGTFNILDLAVNGTNVQQNLCSNGEWYSSPTNPYFYNLECNGLNGKQISMLSSFESYNGAYIMNQLVDNSISANINTVYVATLFSQNQLNIFESNGATQSMNQINLTTAGTSLQISVLINNNGIVSPNCALFGSNIGTCQLTPFQNGMGIPAGVKMMNTPSSVSVDPLIMGSSTVGLFTDNNMFSYYF